MTERGSQEQAQAWRHPSAINTIGPEAYIQWLSRYIISIIALRKGRVRGLSDLHVRPDNKLLKRKWILPLSLPLENPSKSLKIAAFSPI
jgi:hypothetical protein